MLADNSICCIDEFDKMDQKDQVAIHEAMEQQTISISKARIQATMNSRASILAASNPHSDRYDKNLTLKRNVAFFAPLLSRFDLLHIMVDEPDETRDAKIAHHITRVHRALFIQEEEETFEAPAPPYMKSQMQLYIKYIRTIKPKLTPQATELITDSYVKLRQLDTNPGSKASYRITTRQLEALIRLSEALARIHCSNAILSSHVKEAARLIENSVNTLSTPDVELEDIEGPVQSMQNGLGHARQATLPETMEEDILKTSSAVPIRGTSEVSGDKVDLATYETVKRLLVRILRQREEDENQEEVGMTQNELLKQYFREQLFEVNLEPHEISEKMIIIQKLLGMFIFKDNILIILSTPEKQADESEEAYEIRKRKERVLAVHPNYTEAS